MELFLMCIAVAYTLTGKFNKDTAQSAYKAGKEPPGLVKARMRHESGGGNWKPTKSGKSKPAGKGGARLVLASKWAQACEKTKDRSDAKHRAWRAWFAEQADEHDQQWRDKQARRIAKSEQRAEQFARTRGILAHPVAARADKHERQAWDENARRDSDADQSTGQDTEQALARTRDEAQQLRQQEQEQSADGEAGQSARDDEHDRCPHCLDGGWVLTGQGMSPCSCPAGVAEGHTADNDTDGELAEEPAATTETPTSAQTGGTAVYEAAAAKLHAAAEGIERYRADLAAMADGLAAKQWGTEVHGPIGDMDQHLADVAGSYRDLAGQMQQQGDSVNDAHDEHPYVPGGDVVLA